MTLLVDPDLTAERLLARRRRANVIAGTAITLLGLISAGAGGWQVWQSTRPPIVWTLSGCYDQPRGPTVPGAEVQTCTKTWLGDGHTSTVTIDNFAGTSLDGVGLEEYSPSVANARAHRPTAIVRLIGGGIFAFAGLPLGFWSNRRRQTQLSVLASARSPKPSDDVRS